MWNACRQCGRENKCETLSWACLLWLLGFLTFAGCSNNTTTQHTTDKQETLKLRVVSLAPSLTEMVRTLGMEDQLVGISEHCPVDAFPDGRIPTNVGRIDEPSMERLISLRPDIVLLSNLTPPSVGTRIETMGIRTARFNHGNLASVLDDFAKIGRVLGVETEAEAILNNWRKRVGRVRSIIRDESSQAKPQPTVIFLFDFQDLFSAGRGAFVGDLIELAGAENLGARSGVAWPRLSREFILDHQPSRLIGVLAAHPDRDALGKRRLEELRRDPFWSRIVAVREGKILWLLNTDISVPGEGSVRALEAIARFLYPDSDF